MATRLTDSGTYRCVHLSKNIQGYISIKRSKYTLELKISSAKSSMMREYKNDHITQCETPNKKDCSNNGFCAMHKVSHSQLCVCDLGWGGPNCEKRAIDWGNPEQDYKKIFYNKHLNRIFSNKFVYNFII